jgi:hypothetical protein
MVKAKSGRKAGGALMNSLNKSIKDVNKSLKDPENLLIAVLSLVLLALVVYYLRLQNNNSYNATQEEYEDY